MTNTQKEAVKVEHLSEKSQRKRGIGKTVTIADEPTTPPNAGTEFSNNAHKNSNK